MALTWLVLVVRVPAEPSRHRVAVWRELRRVGALLLSQATWAVPDVPAVADGVVRAGELAVRGDGEMLVLPTGGGSRGRHRPSAGAFHRATGG